MALAHDATSVVTRIENASVSFSHTCTGTEGMLVVAIGGSGPREGSMPFSSITYNGVPLSLTVSDENFGRGTRSYIYTLVAPATGAHTLAVNHNLITFYGEVVAISFTGVDQGSPVYATAHESTGDVNGSFPYGFAPAISTPSGGHAISASYIDTYLTATVSPGGATEVAQEPDWNGVFLAARFLNATVLGFDCQATPGAAGTRSSSLISLKASGVAVPDAPHGVVATAGDTQAFVAFIAPSDDGGSPITGYTATSTPGGFTGTGMTSPITVNGLANGTEYTLTVHATNANGDSSESTASNAVTPAAVGGGRSIFSPGIFARDL